MSENTFTNCEKKEKQICQIFTCTMYYNFLLCSFIEKENNDNHASNHHETGEKGFGGVSDP